MTSERIIGFSSLRHDVCGQLISSDGFLHHRRSFEYNVLITVTEGTLHITSGGERHSISSGQYILLEAGGEHYGHQPSEGRLSYMWAHFSAQPESEPKCSFAEHGSITNSERLFFLFRQLIELSLEDQPLRQRMSDHTLALILMELSREQLVGAGGGSELPQVISSVSEWIKANYFKPFTVQQLGEMFGYQADYLSSLFKRAMGVSLVRYTNQIRIRSAKNLLLNYGLSVKETAYSCGFADEKYFMRIFKEHEGVTPSQYRSSVNQNHH